MIDSLVTCLPFYRIHEISDYFVKNRDNLKPKKAIVYVDNVFSDSQKKILEKVLPTTVEVRTGFWRDRNLCLLQTLKDLRAEGLTALIVDSDNILDDNFQDLDDAMAEAGYDFYSVLEHERKSLHLSPKRISDLGQIIVKGRKLNVFGYLIGGTWRGIYFFGPKQAIRFGKKSLASLDDSAILAAETSLRRMKAGIRLMISDETMLGFVCYYSGARITPWLDFSTHFQHSPTTAADERGSKLLVAIAHSEFARGLLNQRFKRSYWYYVRYRIVMLVRSVLGG